MGKKKVTKRRQATQKRKREKRVAAARTRRALGGASFRDVRSWPVRECWVSEGWDSETRGLVQVTVARALRGSWATGVFLVDLDCLGVKNLILKKGQTARGHRELRQSVYRDQPGQACEPELAAKVILEGVAFAHSLGFEPHSDYGRAVHMLAGLDPNRCEVPVPLGRDGEPLYVAGPNDDIESILEALTRSVGPDGFQHIVPVEF